ncbi:MAG: hypothetical protein L0Y66_14990 [Myxococcaceae bacterium]|nr:hypothetical protein [Myxococcaceae bacterium]
MAREGKRVSRSGVEQSLREFVSGLAGTGVASRWSSSLERLAARVLSRVPAGRDVEPQDLVGELVVRLLDARRRNGPGELEALLAVGSLRGVLMHRLAQLASERVPGRSLRRELKGHVRRALTTLRPGLGARRPEALLVQGRYSAARVRAAVAWALAQDVPPVERELVARLVEEYALGVAHVGLEEAAALTAGGDAEAPVLARALCARLGRQGARLVGRQLGGATLRELSEESGRKMTALHTHLHRLGAEVVTYVRASGADPGASRAALQLLAEAA